MMAPTLRRLQNEILRSFDYFKEEFREEKIDNVFITGGSSSLKNLDEYLSGAIGIKAETINPIENIKIDPASGISIDQLTQLSPRLSLAIGLAIDRGSKINFQRARERPKAAKFNLEELLKQIKIPVGLIAWVTAVTLTLAVSYNLYLINVRNQYKKEMLSL